ncbi:hypothetical protein Dda_5292 [Drechslerella dactyloides]|uniref:Peptide N-acetyl-beta-D-glucosaminyl asparaginase amidase A N-terminal domain-containing protein n=1 Tax=Drechslerella dactyloides TaxID=74499 RepID=A0AAD6IX97_DREDA|nr:hypothetical protein Dda_5292 [Drechslerella dactyloides]
MPAAANDLTEFFQVYKPPLAPLTNTAHPHDDFSGEVCSTTLLKYEFVNSYGHPAVAQYTPPPASCDWNTVYFHLYTMSKGRQYDRLAFLFLNDTELWRTSTPEPTAAGIYSTYTKDLTQFSTLLRQSGTLIFDLGNIVTDVLTGTFAVTMTAHYFKLEVPSQHKPADVIAPVSKMQGSNQQPSIFVLPNDIAQSTISVPKDVKKAVLSVIASGNSEEEFWYTNVPDDLKNTFPDTSLLGHSSYREVQVFVDGVMVDAIMPTPAIYTGGINPGLWKPIVCPYAYDLWEAEIDITAWVAGKSNAVIDLQVQGLHNVNSTLEVGGGIGQNWFVSARSFFWTDPTTAPIDASQFTLKASPPTIQYDYKIEGEGAAKVMTFSLSVERQAVVQRTTGDCAVWSTRNQKYSIQSSLFANGNNQTLLATTSVNDNVQIIPHNSTSLSQKIDVRTSEFTLGIDSAFIPYKDTSFFLYGKVNNTYNNQGPEYPLLTDKSALFLNSSSSSEQLGLQKYRDSRFMDDSSSYFSAAAGSNKTSWINGASQQGYRYDLTDSPSTSNRTVISYKRDVRSVYPQVKSDFQSINGVPVPGPVPIVSDPNQRKTGVVAAEAICISQPHGRVLECASR